MKFRNWAGLILLLSGSVITQARKPNIVFIMADDLGWMDVGYNGAEFYETPNIDALCQSGMEFSAGYPGAANCLPSRATIMSGMYTPRTKMWQPGIVSKGQPEYMRLLVPNEQDRKGDGTIPVKNSLAPSVVSLAELLKAADYKTLHLGKWHVGSKDGQGFDQNNVDGRGAGLKMDHKLYGDENVAEWLTDAAVDYINENKDDPFFIYLCHFDVHTPIHARKTVVEKYQKKLESKSWSQHWDPVYAGMVEAVDTSVGRVWTALKDNGLLEDTLIIFTSDNGGLGGATFNAPLKGAKGAFYEGGIRVPLCMSWSGTIKPGSVCDTPVSGVDYMPTFAALADVPLPDPERQPLDGVSLVPLIKGKAITERAIYWHYPLYLYGALPVKPVYGTERIYWRSTPSSIVRKGDWKLMQNFETDSLELYNLKDDIGETQNLASRHPEKVDELLRMLKKWQVTTDANIPTALNPDFDPSYKPTADKKTK